MQRDLRNLTLGLDQEAQVGAVDVSGRRQRLIVAEREVVEERVRLEEHVTHRRRQIRRRKRHFAHHWQHAHLLQQQTVGILAHLQDEWNHISI